MKLLHRLSKSRRCWSLLPALLLCTLVQAATPTSANTPQAPHARRAGVDSVGAEARVIVKYRAGSALMQAASARGTARPLHATALGARLGLVLQDRYVLGARTQSLQGQGVSAAELARQLAAQPDVEWAQPVRRKFINAVLPNDPYYAANQPGSPVDAGQWYLRPPDATFISAINAEGAWAITTGLASVTVAVLDTGITPHPDLLGKYYPGREFTSGSATSGGDATDPGDWSNDGDCGAGSSGSASSWHGTQTAGIVGAATDNALGMASVGRNVMLLPVRVLGQCGGYDDDIIAGMRWAAGLSSSPVVNAHPAQVLNMSLGSDSGVACDAAYQQVFNELHAAGVTVVVAAGNDEGLALGEPADCPYAVTVVALRHAGTKVGFSNVGAGATIAAPGGNCVNLSGPCLYPILSTSNAGGTTASTGNYTSMVVPSLGTSFSAPMVAGTVALMLSVNPALTPDDINNMLRTSARPFPSHDNVSITVCHAPNSSVQDECYCTTSTCGAGMLDAGAAVAAAQTQAAAAPTAVIGVSSATPTAGDVVTLDASGSRAHGGRSIGAYQWQISAGGTLAVFNGLTNTVSTTLQTRAAGSVTLLLTVTDSNGASSSTSQQIVVQAAPASTGGGGGGGVMSLAWLLGLAAATGALAWVQVRLRMPVPAPVRARPAPARSAHAPRSR